MNCKVININKKVFFIYDLLLNDELKKYLEGFSKEADDRAYTVYFDKNAQKVVVF